MDAALQNKLYEKYPQFFQQKDWPPIKTCMCWGITCGEGWYKLIDETIAAVLAVDPEAQAEQVKEKYGGLRLYIKGNDKAQDVVNLAEDKSYRICEMCGRPGIPNMKGWISTLCYDCRRKPTWEGKREKHGKN